MDGTQSMSERSEQRIRAGVGRMVDLIDEGLNPTEALAKTASEMDIPRGHLPIMARIYNISASENWRKTAADVTERAGSFPLADSDAADRLAYPSHVESPQEISKQAEVSPEYSRPPVTTNELNTRQQLLKQAHELATAIHAERLQKAEAARPAPDAPEALFGKAAATKKSYVDCRRETEIAFDRMQTETRKTAERLLLRGATPIPHFCKLAEHQLGDYGAALSRHLLKVASISRLARSQQSSCVNQPACPAVGCRALESAAAAVAAGRDYQKLAADRDRLQKEAMAAKQTAYLPLLKRAHQGVISFSQAGFGFADFSPAAASDDEGHGAKQASLGFMTGVMGTTLGRELSSKLPTAKPTSALVNDMMMDLTDPQHTQQLRGARIGSMLNRLLADDDVIGAYDPREVVQHYNDISQTAPRLAENTELVRGFLRKRLQQGAFDPFDMDMMLKMENNLRRREAPERPFNETEAVDAA